MRFDLKFNLRPIPLPVVIVTTVSKNGIPNAAPHSWYCPCSHRTIGFCVGLTHDTWRNVQETKEFVVNYVGEDLGPYMQTLATAFPYEVNEIEKAGLTEVKSSKVRPPRIAEAYAWCECKLLWTKEFVDEGSAWVVGEVLEHEIKDEYLQEYKGTKTLDVEKAKPLYLNFGEVFSVCTKPRMFKREPQASFWKEIPIELRGLKAEARNRGS